MYKVRTLPVRFGTKKLGEDRSRQPCNRAFKATETLCKQSTPATAQCLLKGGFVWDTEQRLGFPVRQCRFVLELDGVVVVAYYKLGGIWRKYLKNLGVTRTAPGTDRRHGFPLDSLQCLKRQGDKFNITESNVFFPDSAGLSLQATVIVEHGRTGAKV